MSIRNYLYWFTIIITAVPLSVSSQGFADHIGAEDGLSSQLCQKLIEDAYGNLWISSFEYIQKYDGYEVASFRLPPVNKKQLPVVDFASDGNHMIWILQSETASNSMKNHLIIEFDYHITIVDPITNKFIKFENYIDTTLLSLSNISNIHTAEGTIYISTNDNNLFTFKNKLKFHSNLGGNGFTYAISQNENVIKYNETSIEIYDKAGRHIDSISADQINKYDRYLVSPIGEIFFLEEDKDITSVSKYQNKKISSFITFQKDKNLSYIHYIETTDQDEIIINTRLYKYLNQNIEPLHSALGKQEVYDYLKSSTGVEYYATNIGVFVKESEPKIFNTFCSQDETGNSVRAIYITEDLNAFKIHNTEIIRSPSGRYDLDFLSGENLGTMATQHYIDPLDLNKLWSTGYVNNTGGIRMINFAKEELNKYSFKDTYPHRSNCIIRNRTNKKLYVGGNNGLYINSDTYFNKVPIDIKGITNFEVNQIIDRNNQMWIASSAGLIIYDNILDSFYLKTPNRADR